MARLDFSTEPSFECADDDAGDLTFAHATSLFGGRDVVEEYLAAGCSRFWLVLASVTLQTGRDQL
jgi:hypothetical protein